MASLYFVHVTATHYELYCFNTGSLLTAVLADHSIGLRILSNRYYS